jgi:peptidoglycan hydrolase-like protein with peptidoglycan-binding domain
VRPWDSGAGQAASAPSGTPTPVPSTTGASPVTYPCQFYEYEGLDYAGHSTTLTTEFGLGSNGEPIAEVQCLVKRHGFDPGAIDGIFGPNTEAAVIAFQRDQGLAGDGIVGPQTWRALRGG